MERFAAHNMVRVVIYADPPKEAEAIEPLLRQTILSRRQWPLIQKFPGDLPGFLRYVAGNPYLIMLVAAPGPTGSHVVRQIRQGDPAARLVWLSDRQNALGAYGEHVTAFGSLPATGRTLEEVMDACDVRGRTSPFLV